MTTIILVAERPFQAICDTIRGMKAKYIAQNFAKFAGRRLLLINLGALVFIKILLPLGHFGVATISDPLKPSDTSVIIEQTNIARQAANLTALTRNPQLDQAAQAKLASMEQEGYFAHVTPEGRQPWDFIRDQGYRYRAAGENLAKGFTDPTSVVTAWMNSPTHHANLVSPLYTDIGVAEKQIILEGVPQTVVVQMFGSPLPTAAPAPVPTKAPQKASLAAHQPQMVSTNTQIAPVAAPVKVVVPSAPATAELSQTVGSALSIYLTAILGVLILALGLIEYRRPAFWAFAGNIAILALAVALPSMPTVTHLIF